MLSLKNYTVSADKKDILTDINLSLEAGKTYALMGPNGSGKSTLALSLLGAPNFTVKKGSKAEFKEKDILSLPPEKRAQLGLFVTFQSPMEFSGITLFQLLRVALPKIPAIELKSKLETSAKMLHVSEELLSRPLNENFSGGERKKMEMLQMSALNPDCVFFDEIDTGVDVDALQTIAEFLKNWKTPEKTLIIITHYTRILNYISPDEVIILKDGKIAKTGDKNLAKEIEEKGYENI